jgi:isopentenyl-diphosphate delta-isomerase
MRGIDMTEFPTLSSRKSDHININLEQDVRSGLTTGFEKYRFMHEALPDINLDEIDLSQALFGRRIRVPLLISSMTGGTPEAERINLTLAEAAQEIGAAMGLGSQRAAIEQPQLAATFQVRKVAPDILLFANLGAVQLNYSYGVDQCRRAVDMVGADALMLHLNPLQEALQPEGDTRFAGLLGKIEAVCRGLDVPVIAKEVGWGISQATARRLAGAGVAGLDVAGAGGTSWSQVEMYRIRAESLARVAGAFRGWGIPTAESLEMVRQAAPELVTIASGGIKDGIDIAKSIALGASLGGMAGYFLKPAVHSLAATRQAMGEICREIQVCMFAAGARNLEQLRKTELVKVN